MSTVFTLPAISFAKMANEYWHTKSFQFCDERCAVYSYSSSHRTSGRIRYYPDSLCIGYPMRGRGDGHAFASVVTYSYDERFRRITSDCEDLLSEADYFSLMSGKCTRSDYVRMVSQCSNEMFRGLELLESFIEKPMSVPIDTWASSTIKHEPTKDNDRKVKANKITYLMFSNGFIKCGVTSNIKARVSGVQTGCPTRIEKVMTVNDASLERVIHGMWNDFKTSGEWFKPPQNELTSVVEQFGFAQIPP